MPNSADAITQPLSSKFQVPSSKCGTGSLELGTWNLELLLRRVARRGRLRRRQIPPARPGLRLLDDPQEQLLQRRRRGADHLQPAPVLENPPLQLRLQPRRLTPLAGTHFEPDGVFQQRRDLAERLEVAVVED